MSIWIIFGVFALLSYLVQHSLKKKFEAYSKVPVSLTGKEVAEKMLYESGITGVKVVSSKGFLTDHYNPMTKVVSLSEDVYFKNNVAAAAVAAHECGHAIQHARQYAFLQFRSALVPVVSFSSRWVQWVILAGILLIQSFPQLLLIGIVLFGLTTLFSVITLPVEINASSRALVWLNTAGITNVSTYPKAKSALKAAAYTYIVAALGSLATLFYYVMIYMGRRN